MQLKDRLIGMQSKLEIVPIVGMGGVGKTTLARKLYEDQLIVSRFEYRAWTTISQDYNMRAILLGLLRCIVGKECDQHIEMGNDELKDILYRSLYGRRYLIVLDDIWSTKFWDEMRMYFPDNVNGSRIVITTRESDVAQYADSRSQQHQVQLLSKSESWNLLHRLVFGEDDCPHELQEIGEKIASDCGGLPLAINVIGGLLSKMEISKDIWEKTGNDVIVAIAESDKGKQFGNILSLSYNHLPNHLKPCFLYMGAFPEDYEIKGSRLVPMWVAEGFLKSNGDKSLEEEAEECLKALVERNLLLVRHYKYGKPKSYNMHDLLRDVCIRKSDEEKFLRVKNVAPELTFSNHRRVSAHRSPEMTDAYGSVESMSLLTRSLLYIGFEYEFLIPAFSPFRLLKVLDAIETEFYPFPREILQLVNLRYLAINFRMAGIPSDISRLWNLQTLIAICDTADVPCEIWGLSELRHLKLKDVIWFKDEKMKMFVQKKLQTISLVKLNESLIRMGFFESIPNIKKLGIFFQDSTVPLAIDLTHLHKLEILKCKSYPGGSPLLGGLRFPCNLQKLSLVQCPIYEGELRTLCALPSLQVLKIRGCMLEEWEVAEGDEFGSLQFLHLHWLDVVHWRADETNFPRLHHLSLRHCPRLEEIPCGIGEIPTLQLIELYGCNSNVVASAKQIEEVQQSDYGNYDLKLRILSL